MILNGSLATAISGLRVAQEGLNTTAHNVANVNTPGFSRKVTNQETVVLGGRGVGATVSDIERIVDQFLVEQVQNQQSEVGRSETLARYQDRLQSYLGAPGEDADLATQLGAFGAAVQALANSPDSGAMALEVVELGRSTAGSLARLADQVEQLRSEAGDALRQTVDQVNLDLQTIAELNREISQLAMAGQPTGDFADRRSEAIRNLAGQLDISTFEQDDGVVVVQTRRGAPLADTSAREVQYDPATGLSPAPITGGKLSGLLETRDDVLPTFAGQLEELAGMLRHAVNAAHNDAVPIPPPANLTGTRTDFNDFATASRTGTATFAVIDADGTTAKEFPIDLGTMASEGDVLAAIDGGLAGYGSASWGSDGQLQIALSDASQGLAIAEGDSAIRFTDAEGHDRTYGLSHYFGLNDFFVLQRSQETSLAVRSDLVATPARVGTAKLDTSSGAALLGGPGDDRGIRALADTLQAQHAVIAQGNLPAGQVTIAGYASDIVADAAIAAERGGQAADQAKALADALQFRAEAVSGVNVDEEMARMIQIQNAYTASARLITVTDEMLDELFRIAR